MRLIAYMREYTLVFQLNPHSKLTSLIQFRVRELLRLLDWMGTSLFALIQLQVSKVIITVPRKITILLFADNDLSIPQISALTALSLFRYRDCNKSVSSLRQHHGIKLTWNCSCSSLAANSHYLHSATANLQPT